MKRVLVCVDGSEVSDRALEMAVELARATGVQVTVAHVVAPLTLPVDGYPTAVVEPGAAVQLERQAREFGELVAGRAAQRARELGAQAEAKVLLGDPARALAEEAEAHDYGLVAIGSRGQGAFKRALLGSTSDRLVHTCKRPVLVVH
jgi:nucleotide-binding universal stress UspA family protein